jgi:hypothetical protein
VYGSISILSAVPIAFTALFGTKDPHTIDLLSFFPPYGKRERGREGQRGKGEREGGEEGERKRKRREGRRRRKYLLIFYKRVLQRIERFSEWL